MVTTGKELAAKVAEQIRTRGHYQGQPSMEGDPTACLIANDYVLRAPREVRNEYFGELYDAIGLDQPVSGLGPIIRFNDTHSTTDVLTILDHVAQGAQS